LRPPVQRSANAPAVLGFCQRSYSTLQVVAEKATIAISCPQRSKAPNCPKLCYIISVYSSVWLNPSPTETISSLCKIAPLQRTRPKKATATADALRKFSLLMALHKKIFTKLHPVAKKRLALNLCLFFCTNPLKKEIGSNYLFNRHKAMLIFLEDCQGKFI